MVFKTDLPQIDWDENTQPQSKRKSRFDSTDTSTGKSGIAHSMAVKEREAALLNRGYQKGMYPATPEVQEEIDIQNEITKKVSQFWGNYKRKVAPGVTVGNIGEVALELVRRGVIAGSTKDIKRIGDEIINTARVAGQKGLKKLLKKIIGGDTDISLRFPQETFDDLGKGKIPVPAISAQKKFGENTWAYTDISTDQAVGGIEYGNKSSKIGVEVGTDYDTDHYAKIGGSLRFASGGKVKSRKKGTKVKNYSNSVRKPKT